MRYIITHKEANSAQPVSLLAHAAEIADSAEQAADQFTAKHPDRVVVMIERVNDLHNAFERYGLGAWTDEEQAETRGKLRENYAAAERERGDAELIARTYEPDEFAAVIAYKDRRAAERTQNLEGVHVGDLFYVMWGYEQTNYNFFQVVGLRGKHTIILRENERMCADYGFMRGLSRPIRNQFRGEQRYTLRTRYDERLGRVWINAPEDFGRGHGLTPCADGKLFDYTSYA